MEEIEIITLSHEGWKQYRDLRLRALKEEPQAYSSTYEENVKHPDEFWMERLKDSEDGKQWLLFAKRGEELVGMAGGIFLDEKDTVYVIAMYVAKEERGQGISKKLMEGLIEKVKENKLIRKLSLRVSTNQPEAQNLYKSFGFKEFKQEKIVLGDGEERIICYMEKILD
jgi:ribosomal protein S18 acetylase RimI-like enzyme